MDKSIIKESLWDDINEFCKANDIENTNVYINEMLYEKFMELKWNHATPTPKVSNTKQEKETEKVVDHKVTPTKPKSNKDFYGE